MSDSAYEVLLGFSLNGRSSISKKGDPDKTVAEFTPDILSCTETRFFWVSWGGFVISVGKGRDVGYNTLMSLNDISASAVDVNVVGFSGAISTEYVLADADGMLSIILLTITFQPFIPMLTSRF